jgi:hypothetical protein
MAFWKLHHIQHQCQAMIENIHQIPGCVPSQSWIKIEKKGWPYRFQVFIAVLLKDFPPTLTMMNEWTVIPNHDLRRQKKADDTGSLSMGRHRPVTTLMNRSLTKVRDGMSENMVQAPPMWKTTLGMTSQQMLQQWKKSQAFNHVPRNVYIVKNTTN